MNYTSSQIKCLIAALKKHIKGTDKDKRAAETIMKKYGCNSSAEAYRLIKSNCK